MKTATAPLITLLNSNLQLAYADLFTFTFLDGTSLRYTSADKPVPWGGNTFTVGPLIKRGRVKLQVGISVDTLDIQLSAGPGIQVNSKPLMAFIAAGGMDGARVRLERAFMPDWQSPVTGVLQQFSGRINDVSIGRFEVALSVQSDLELLNTKVPRNLYQPGCVNTVYDGACGKNRTALTVTNAVTASPTPTKSVFDSTLTQATGYFDLGVVAFTSGANASISRTIKSFVSGGLITTIAPFPFAPAAGDTFTVYPGCDKTMATCNSRFSNLPRFRGFPFIPVPETVT
jgi:uncharacterized phage protein (TIGR02218 family)